MSTFIQEVSVKKVRAKKVVDTAPVVVEEVALVEEEEVVAPVVAQKVAVKRVKKVIEAAAPVVEAAAPVVVDEDQEKVSNVVSRESVAANFDEIVALIETEIELLKVGDKTNPKVVSFLRNIKTRLNKLKKNAIKISKGKVKRQVSTGAQSGFLKPVAVSDEIRKFAGWEKGELHSRVDVTKFICAHIKQQNLQNKEDRRQIEPDAKLKKLLNIPSSSKETIPYYQIQQKIKHHFITAAPPIAEAD